MRHEWWLRFLTTELAKSNTTGSYQTFVRIHSSKNCSDALWCLVPWWFIRKWSSFNKIILSKSMTYISEGLPFPAQWQQWPWSTSPCWFGNPQMSPPVQAASLRPAEQRQKRKQLWMKKNYEFFGSLVEGTRWMFGKPPFNNNDCTRWEDIASSAK